MHQGGLYLTCSLPEGLDGAAVVTASPTVRISLQAATQRTACPLPARVHEEEGVQCVVQGGVADGAAGNGDGAVRLPGRPYLFMSIQALDAAAWEQYNVRGCVRMRATVTVAAAALLDTVQRERRQ